MQIYLKGNCLDKHIEEISENFNFEMSSVIPDKPFLHYDESGLSFIMDPHDLNKRNQIDFLKGKLGWRLKRSQHESNLKKALGKSKIPLSIFDATPGFLSDAMIFLSLGHKVNAVEQSEIIYSLVKDAIRRASTELDFLNNLEFSCGNSLKKYSELECIPDVIYLDPMYPILKKNQKKSSHIETITFILKEEKIECDSEELIEGFLKKKYQKIILKRPLKFEKKYSNINYQVKGSTTRFDIYL